MVMQPQHVLGEINVCKFDVNQVELVAFPNLFGIGWQNVILYEFSFRKSTFDATEK